MKKNVIGLTAIILLAACQQNKNDILVDQCTGYLKHNLKDPDSLRITEVSTIVISENTTFVLIKYNAKNGFGGYSGIDNIYCEFNKDNQIIRVFSK